MKKILLQKTTQQTNSAAKYTDYALYAFGGLGLEILIMMAETYLYGRPSGDWPSMACIVHWLITSFTWGCIGIALAKKLPSIPENHIKRNNLLLAVTVITLSILCTTLVWKGFKPAVEFSALGLSRFFFQYIYYAFESLLILLIIAHGQKALECRFGDARPIPFGGIFLAVTWGFVHILTQSVSTGFYSVIQSMLFGCVYMLLHKNYKLSYISIALMFML